MQILKHVYFITTFAFKFKRTTASIIVPQQKKKHF